MPLLLILVACALMRLLHLSYSHFQGDEIKALYPPEAAFPDFLFAQRKGPVQFLITRSVGALTGGYVEWQTRLPFALASLLGVYAVYRLTRERFGRRAGLLAAALVGSCGLLVAFGRIVQYQAFCMLFVLLAAYWLFRSLSGGHPRLLYAGLICYALALLTHYDALTFAPTLALLLAVPAFRHAQATRGYLVHVTLASAIAVSLVILFYLPYILQPLFPSVRAYLLHRVASGRGIQTFTATYDLLGLYLPPLYLACTIPLLLIGALAVLRREWRPDGLILLTWFVTPFLFYMGLGGDPRSHVYTYVLPGLILAALGIDTVIAAAQRPLAHALSAAAWALIALFAAITYYMLVDHTVEHPWYRKTIIGYELPNLVSRQIRGVFGFPYRRGLDQVGTLFRSGRLQGTFDSNERDVMADYYFEARRSDKPDYYIYVLRPLSLHRDVPLVVARSYRRIMTIAVEGRPTIEIYEAPWRAALSGGVPDTPRLSSGPRRVTRRENSLDAGRRVM